MRIETEHQKKILELYRWDHFLEMHHMYSTQLEELKQQAIASNPPINPELIDTTLREFEWLKSVMENEVRTVTHKMMNIIYEPIKILSSMDIEHSVTNPAYSEPIYR